MGNWGCNPTCRFITPVLPTLYPTNPNILLRPKERITPIGLESLALGITGLEPSKSYSIGMGLDSIRDKLFFLRARFARFAAAFGSEFW